MNERSSDKLIQTITGAFISNNVSDSNGEAANVVDALDKIAVMLKYLGNAEASTPMGALEAHGKAVLDAAEEIKYGLYAVAEAIDGLGEGKRS